jgi:hypothetical protein
MQVVWKTNNLEKFTEPEFCINVAESARQDLVNKLTNYSKDYLLGKSIYT